MKSRDLQPRLLYPAKLSFRIEGQIKCFPDIITKPLLYEMLKGLKKKKNIKTMNNRMTINTGLSTIKSKKQSKQTRRTGTESQMESVLMVTRWEVVWGMGEEGRGLRSTNR